MTNNFLKILLYGSIAIVMAAAGVLMYNLFTKEEEQTTTTVNIDEVYEAILSRDKERYRQYIDDGADLSFAFPEGIEQGRTPLEVIIENFDLEYAQKIMENGFDLTKVDNNHMDTLTSIISFNEDRNNEVINSIAIELINQVKDELDNPDSYGYSLLINTLTIDNDIIVTEIIKNIDDVDLVYNGRTALNYACTLGYVNLDIIKELISKGADINNKGYQGYTCLMNTVMSMDNETLTYLLTLPELDINATNDYGQTALHLTVEYSNEEAVDILMKNSSIDATLKDINGETALTYACIIPLDNSSIVKKMIENGVDVNALGAGNNSCLMNAVVSKQNDTINYLLTLTGINLNIINNKGQTALHLAVEAMNVEIIDILLAENIDININDNDGYTAKAYAEKLANENPTVTEYQIIYEKLSK